MKKLLTLFSLTILIGLSFITTAYADDPEEEPTTVTTTPADGNQCEGENNFLAEQKEDESYSCVELDPDGDEDNDRTLNKSDNCPITPNGSDTNGNYNGDTNDEPEEDENIHQADSDNDGVGDECDLSPRSRIVSDIQNQAGFGEEEISAKSEGAFQKTLGTLGACLPTGTGGLNHRVCNRNSTFSSLSSEDEIAKFNRLYEAMLNNEIITTLEEPISNQGIYRKARVCSTKFLRDINGIVQPTTSIDLYNPDLEDDELLDRFKKLEYLTTNDKCEDFFVQRCDPANTTNFVIPSTNQELPTRVYCNNVQILFASSGSDLVKKYVSLIYRLAAGIIGIIAVVVIIINGIIISASGGESGTVDNAKNRIIQSLVSLAILFLSGIILYSINPNFFRTDTANQITESAQEQEQEQLNDTE